MLKPAQIELEGKIIRTDEEGYLVDPGTWTGEVAEELARREGVALSALHWNVLHFMRHYFAERQIAPDARKLLPYGYVKQACKIAGMRRPRAWSTG